MFNKGARYETVGRPRCGDGIVMTHHCVTARSAPVPDVNLSGHFNRSRKRVVEMITEITKGSSFCLAIGVLIRAKEEQHHNR